MVEAYAMEESMGFLTKYMQDFMPVNRKMWDAEKGKNVSGEVLEGASKSVYLGLAIQNIAHHYVLTNTTTMACWVR
jgi:hypothetical protein